MSEPEFERKQHMTFSFSQKTEERLMSLPKGERSETLENLFNAWWESRHGEVDKELLQRKINKLQVQLSPLLTEYRELEEREELARELNVRKKIEEDCHAEYLCELIRLGKINQFKRVPKSRDDILGILERVIDRMEIRNIVDTENLEIASSDPFQLRSIERALYKFGLGLDGNKIIELSKETEFITPEPAIREMGIRLSYTEFARAFISGGISASSSPEDLKRFSPRITDSIVLAKVKKQMLDDLVRKGITVDEAKNRVEKPWGEKR